MRGMLRSGKTEMTVNEWLAEYGAEFGISGAGLPKDMTITSDSEAIVALQAISEHIPGCVNESAEYLKKTYYDAFEEEDLAGKYIYDETIKATGKVMNETSTKAVDSIIAGNTSLTPICEEMPAIYDVSDICGTGKVKITDEALPEDMLYYTIFGEYPTEEQSVGFITELRNSGVLRKINGHELLVAGYIDGTALTVNDIIPIQNGKKRSAIVCYLTENLTEANKAKYMSGYDYITEIGKETADKLRACDESIAQQAIKAEEASNRKFQENYFDTRRAREELEMLNCEYACKKAQDNLLEELYFKVSDYVADFERSLKSGKTPTKSELLRNEQYVALLKEIDNAINDYKRGSVTNMNDLKSKIASMTLITPEMVKSVVNTEFAGANYSTRVWSNADALAGRLKNTIAENVILGKSYSKITTELKRDFGVARYQAERLIRTESSYVFNKASRDSFKNAGLQQIAINVESGACDACRSLKGKVWNIGEEPTLPIHPNCKCSYRPIVPARTKA